MYSARSDWALPQPGFPIRTSLDLQLARSSPERFVACHVLHRLLAPRHPPRALCSLTSLNNSPNRQLPRDVRDHSPCRSILGRNRSSKKTQFLPITSSLCKVRRASPASPAIRWSVTSRHLPRAHGSGDRGRLTPRDDSKTSSRHHRPAWGSLFESLRGLPDIQFHRQVRGQQSVVLSACPGAGRWWRRGDSNS